MKSLLTLLVFILTFIQTSTSSCRQNSKFMPSSCAEIFVQGNTKSGVYTIQPRPWYGPYQFDVYCDMETDGGGWTVIQRRDDYKPRENFYRYWNDYKRGFGKLEKEFWLGNEYIYILTNQDRVTLRIDLEDFDEHARFAEYQQFQISDESNNYKLSLSGYHGTSGDGLSDYMGTGNGALFTTLDKNDNIGCSKLYKGGWWYMDCHETNINGLYLKGKHSSYADGINWNRWHGYHYSLKKTEMKVRPINFSPCTSLRSK